VRRFKDGEVFHGQLPESASLSSLKIAAAPSLTSNSKLLLILKHNYKALSLFPENSNITMLVI